MISFVVKKTIRFVVVSVILIFVIFFGVIFILPLTISLWAFDVNREPTKDEHYGRF